MNLISRSWREHQWIGTLFRSGNPSSPKLKEFTRVNQLIFSSSVSSNSLSASSPAISLPSASPPKCLNPSSLFALPLPVHQETFYPTLSWARAVAQGDFSECSISDRVGLGEEFEVCVRTSLFCLKGRREGVDSLSILSCAFEVAKIKKDMRRVDAIGSMAWAVLLTGPAPH